MEDNADAQRPNRFRKLWFWLRVLSALGAVVGVAFEAGVQWERWTADDENSVHAKFIRSRRVTYRTAMDIVEQLPKARETTESILNFRAASSSPEQNKLYEAIIDEVRKGDILYTRVATIESDPRLEVTRYFLTELGSKQNVRIIVTAGNPAVPSCFITDDEALLGFQANDGTINHGLHITGPESLVNDLRTMYFKILTSPNSAHQIKAFDETIPEEAVDRLLDELRAKLLMSRTPS